MQTIEEIQERAMRAQKVARKYLVSHWAPFVRMFSRSPKMPVRLTAGQPRTDGKTTWLRVPIELGDDIPHDKALCGHRDPETAIMLCKACAVMDKAMFTIYHESSHTIFGSFEALSDYDRREIIVEAIRLEAAGKDESTRAAKLRKRVDRDINFIESYIGAANLVSPYLPFLLNAIEDVYVNAAMIEARPGIRNMAKAAYSTIFINGNEMMDGRVHRWTDEPLDLQVVIGVLLKASGIPIGDWLDPQIVQDMDDPRIEALCAEVLDSKTARLRYRLAIKFLETLRSMGYFKAADDPEDDPEPEGDGDPEGDAEGETDEPESSDDGDEGEPGDGADSGDEDSDDESDEDGAGGSGADDDEDSDEEESDGGSGEGDDSDDGSEEGAGDGDDDSDTESTGADAEDSDDGSSGSGGDMDADDDTFGDEGEASDADTETGDVESSSTSNPGDIERAFKTFGGHDHESDPGDDEDGDDEPDLTPEEEEEREELERALSQGEHFDKPSVLEGGLRIITKEEGIGAFRGNGHVRPVEQSILGPALLKARIAFTNNKKGKRERNLESGSRLDGHVLATRFTMGDKRLFEKRSRPGKRDYFVCIGLDVSGSTSRALGGVRLVEMIKQAAFAQAELCNKLGVKFAVYAHTGDHGQVVIHEVKSPEEPWGPKQRQALGSLTHYLANLDGHTLEFYRKVLDRRTETDRVILYYTDGAMPLENYEEELAVLQENIRICKRRGYVLMGVGVLTDSPKEHGLDTVQLDGPEDIPGVVEALRKRLV